MGIKIGDLVIRRSVSKGLLKSGPRVPIGTDGRVVEYGNGDWVVTWTGLGTIGIPDADIRCSKHRRRLNHVCGWECGSR